MKKQVIGRSIIIASFLSLNLACEPKVKEKIIYIEVPGEKEIIEKTVSDDKTPITTTTSATDDSAASAAKSSVAFTGALAIAGADANAGGLALRKLKKPHKKSNSLFRTVDTTGTYSLYCTTFEATPTACSGTVGTNKDFDFSCEKFAGKSFGCFLRLGETTLSAIEFAGDTTLVAGAGKISAAITYDPESKMASAAIDSSLSSALNPAAIEAAKEAAGVEDTSLVSLTGMWSIQCQNDAASGINCDSGMDISSGLPEAIYMAQFNATGGKKKVALWESKQKHDQCISGGTDAQPNFGMSIGSHDMNFSFTSTADLEASIDQVYASFNTHYPQIASSLAEKARAQEAWSVQQCEISPYTADNCKLIAPEIVSYTYYDYNTNQELTESYPTWYWDLASSADLSDYTGTISNGLVQCQDDPANWQEGIEYCPWGVTLTETNGKKFYTKYSGKDVNNISTQLMLVCKDNAYGSLIQSPAFAATKAASLTMAEQTRGCDRISDASSPFDGKLQSEVSAIRRAVLDLASYGKYYDMTNVCDGYDFAAGFDFSMTCQPDTFDEGSGTYSYNYMCADIDSIKSNLALAADGNGKLVADTGAAFGWLDTGDALILCPTAYNTFSQSAWSAESEEALKLNCQTEIAALNLSQQLALVKKYSLRYAMSLQAIACQLDGGNQNRIDLVSGLSNACMPDAYIDYICDGKGNCAQGLRCNGSNSGACYDDDGVFSGMLPGRIGVMDIKQRVDGAFELSNSVIESWFSWDPSTNENQECSMVYSTVLNARSADDAASEFSGFYSNKYAYSCKESSAGTTQDPSVNETPPADPAMNGDTAVVAGEVPTTEIISKLKFTRCADANNCP